MVLPSLIVGCWTGQVWAQVRIEHLGNETYEKAGLPFSEAVEVDGWLILSGAIGTRPGTTELVPGGIGPESRQVMKNIEATLARMNASMDRVAKCTIMLADIGEWPQFNEVHKSYFEAPYPARSAFATSGLALGAAVEVKCLARR